MNSDGLKSFVTSRRNVLVCLLLAVVTCAIYWQVSGFEFTNYDEFKMVLNNPYVLGGLTLHGLSWALTTSWFEYWHPLTWLSHMLDCELFGLNPGGHHLVSLGFHVANTVLLFMVLERMTGAPWRSATVAALFALHPMHVESVAWIAERKDVLSGFFFFLTLWAYYRYAECGTQKQEFSHTASASPPSAAGLWYWSAVAMFACGLMCKPMLVTLPFVLLLLDYWPLGRMQNAECGMQNHAPHFTFHVSRRTSLSLFVEKLPFFALTAASCAITYLGVKAGGNIISAEKVPWGLRLANVPVSYVRYIGKMIWPSDLIAFYPMPSHWAAWQVGGAILVLALVSVFAVLRARSAPYFIVGWVFFLGTLVPTIGIVQAGFQSIADRYTYIPSIGICIAVVWSVTEWAQGKSRAGVSPAPSDVSPDASRPTAAHDFRKQIPWPAWLMGVAAAVLLGCGYLTWVQARTWRNSLELWTHCLAVCPGNVVANYNLGYVLQHSNHPSEAMVHYRAALQFKPDHLDANLNLGIALIGVGRAQEATNYLAAALRIKPDYARAQGAMGLARYQLGDYAEAVVHCAEAIRLDPDAFGPYVDMARALSAQGKTDDALRYYSEGLRLNPGIAQTHYYLGLEWMKRGLFDQAAGSFGEAARLAPTWAEARAQQQRALNDAKRSQDHTDER